MSALKSPTLSTKIYNRAFKGAVSMAVKVVIITNLGQKQKSA